MSDTFGAPDPEDGSPTELVNIHVVNNDGGGFAERKEFHLGTTLEQLFRAVCPNGAANDYVIRVNRSGSERDYVLQDGDRVTITPRKIEGAL